MKTILFLFDNFNTLFILKFLEKYLIKSDLVEFKNENLIAGVPKKIPNDLKNGLIKFEYNNHIISTPTNIFYENHNDIDELYFSEYDEVYFFKTFNREASYENHNRPGFKMIYINYGERVHHDENTFIKNLNNNKVVSCSNFKNKDLISNYFYEYKLNFLQQYFEMGYDFVRFRNGLKVDKTFLLGLYYTEGYKGLRDNTNKEILNLSNFKIDYFSSSKENDFYKTFLIFSQRDYWYKNHTSTFTDYLTSVCGYVFETLNYNQDFETKLRLEYLSEKTLKALLFSIHNIPFILDCNPYSFVSLNSDGYWFLNSEFFNGTENDSHDVITEKMKVSIIKSIEFLNKLYEDYDGNFNDIHQYFIDNFGNKMQKNFELIDKYLTNPDNDKLLNFILE